MYCSYCNSFYLAYRQYWKCSSKGNLLYYLTFVLNPYSTVALSCYQKLLFQGSTWYTPCYFVLHKHSNGGHAVTGQCRLQKKGTEAIKMTLHYVIAVTNRSFRMIPLVSQQMVNKGRNYLANESCSILCDRCDLSNNVKGHCDEARTMLPTSKFVYKVRASLWWCHKNIKKV